MRKSSLPSAKTALAIIKDSLLAEHPIPRSALATACRAICYELELQYGGRTIELRVPPFAAVQLNLGEGSTHRRGTPPNVVEITPELFCKLSLGLLTWQESQSQIVVSGVHATQVGKLFPLSSVN